MGWLKHFFWFIKTSKEFMGLSYFKLLKMGLVSKGIKHSNYMVKWDRLTPEQREQWYLSGEGRTLEF